MTFEILDKEEFRIFLDNHPLKTFFQTPEMEEIGLLDNWKTLYVGVKKNNKIMAATRVMFKTVRFNKKIFYAPRGILIDYDDTNLLNFFVKHMKKFIKKQGGYTLHIDPPLIYKERDINGDIVENGIDNSAAIDNLKKLGFHHDGFIRYYDYTKQVRWSFELPLEDKDENTILKEMAGNTRRAIGKATHLKVTVRQLKKEELGIFKDIMNSTSERRDFCDKSLTYYEKMYDLFYDKNEIKYMVAEVNLNETLEVLNQDKLELEKDKLRATKHNKKALLNETENQLKDLDNKINSIIKIQKEKGNHIYLSAAMFMIYGNDILYYHSGGYKEYMSFFGQYLIQWTMIKEAIKLGKKCYNFYGIKGVFDKNDPDYGVYLFKRGFNGHVIEYIGDFYLPISPYYYILQIRKKLKK